MSNSMCQAALAECARKTCQVAHRPRPRGRQPRGRGLASTITTDNICVHTERVSFIVKPCEGSKAFARLRRARAPLGHRATRRTRLLPGTLSRLIRRTWVNPAAVSQCATSSYEYV